MRIAASSICTGHFLWNHLWMLRSRPVSHTAGANARSLDRSTLPRSFWNWCLLGLSWTISLWTHARYSTWPSACIWAKWCQPRQMSCVGRNRCRRMSAAAEIWKYTFSSFSAKLCAIFRFIARSQKRFIRFFLFLMFCRFFLLSAKFILCTAK